VIFIDPVYGFVKTQRDREIASAFSIEFYNLVSDIEEEILKGYPTRRNGTFLDPEADENEDENEIRTRAFDKVNKQAGEMEYNAAIAWDKKHGVNVDAPDYAPRPPNMGWASYEDGSEQPVVLTAAQERLLEIREINAIARRREVERGRDPHCFEDEAKYSERPHVRRERLLQELEREYQLELDHLTKNCPRLPKSEIMARVAETVSTYASKKHKYDLVLWDIYQEKRKETIAAREKAGYKWDGIDLTFRPREEHISA